MLNANIVLFHHMIILTYLLTEMHLSVVFNRAFIGILPQLNTLIESKARSLPFRLAVSWDTTI